MQVNASKQNSDENVATMQQFSIGVICMYKAQSYFINKMLSDSYIDSHTQGAVSMQSIVQVSTVDAFQGCEKDIIIICSCRNSDSSFIR